MRRILATALLILGVTLTAPAAGARAATTPQAAATTVSIPVLCYHVVSTTPSGRYQLDLGKFKEQMAYLASNGYTPLSMDQYYAVMTGAAVSPAKPVVLTFDDSTSDFATNVVPVLQQYGFAATEFAVSSWVDTAGHLSSAQLGSLAASYDIQNHTVTHNDLSTMSYAAAYNEISGAGSFIAGATGKSPQFLAYPYGRFGADTQAAARDAGVKMAFTASGGKTTPADDFLALNRYIVPSSETLSSFIKKVAP